MCMCVCTFRLLNLKIPRTASFNPACTTNLLTTVTAQLGGPATRPSHIVLSPNKHHALSDLHLRHGSGYLQNITGEVVQIGTWARRVAQVQATISRGYFLRSKSGGIIPRVCVSLRDYSLKTPFMLRRCCSTLSEVFFFGNCFCALGFSGSGKHAPGENRERKTLYAVLMS